MRADVEQRREQGFAAEARRQSRLLAKRAAAPASDEAEVVRWMEDVADTRAGPREALRKPIGFRRGDLVTVASSGDHGKPRPALIVQAGAYAEHPSLTLLPLTSKLRDMPMLRVTVAWDKNAGLRRRSQACKGWEPDWLSGQGYAGACQPGSGRVPGKLDEAASPGSWCRAIRQARRCQRRTPTPCWLGGRRRKAPGCAPAERPRR